MTSKNQDNRRKFQRILFDSEARIEAAFGQIQVQLIDISLNGALIQCPEQWSGSVGDDLTLIIQLTKEDEFAIHMQTKVTHIEQNHIGLHCEHIDIDSITYLRRLVELNLGDADLLERQLAALG